MVVQGTIYIYVFKLIENVVPCWKPLVELTFEIQNRRLFSNCSRKNCIIVQLFKINYKVLTKYYKNVHIG